MHRLLTISLLCLAGILGRAEAAGTPDEERVAILLPSRAWPQLREPLDAMMASVRRRQSVAFEVIHRDWQNPAEVRNLIAEKHAANRLTGVILVGAMPMHRFHMHGFGNPNPLSYEDWDLAFSDRNGDGIDDHWKGKPQLKVWVANWRTSVKADDDDVPGLTAFLGRMAAHHAGDSPPRARALGVSGSDWPGGGGYFRDGIAPLFGRKQVSLLEGKECTAANLKRLLEAPDWGLMHLQVHSDWNGQDMEDGTLTAGTIRTLRHTPLVVLNHGCSNANWMRNDAEGREPNTAMAWAFGQGSTLAVVGQVRTGMIYGHEQLHRQLRDGRNLGRAYLAAKQAGEEEMAGGDHEPGDIVSGVILMGDPFLTFPAASSAAKRRD